jgi:anti-anti-sigma factor
MAAFTIKTRKAGSSLIIDLIGSAAETSVFSTLPQEIEAVIKNNPGNIAVNLAKADYINSGIIGLFVYWYKLVSERKDEFCLIEPNGKSREVLRLVGIDRVMAIHESEKHFLDSLKG